MKKAGCVDGTSLDSLSIVAEPLNRLLSVMDNPHDGLQTVSDECVKPKKEPRTYYKYDGLRCGAITMSYCTLVTFFILAPLSYRIMSI